MDVNVYDEKRQARIERYRERAAKAQREAEALGSRAREMQSVIPFGQPILVGHHSEKRDRNYRARIDSTHRRSFEASDKAAHYEQKAVAAESNRAISSDDPEAVRKLKEKIEKLERLQATMKACNKVVRQAGLTDAEKIEKMAVVVGAGFVERKGKERLSEILEPDFAGRAGFASYQLTNNGANIRRLKDRLADLERAATGAHLKGPAFWDALKAEHNLGSEIEVVENVDENRIQLIFQGKPSAEIRTLMKGRGFRWSPSNLAWQRHLNSSGSWAAEHVLSQLP